MSLRTPSMSEHQQTSLVWEVERKAQQVCSTVSPFQSAGNLIISAQVLNGRPSESSKFSFRQLTDSVSLKNSSKERMLL